MPAISTEKDSVNQDNLQGFPGARNIKDMAVIEVGKVPSL